MSRIPLLFGIVAMLVGLGAIGYVYGTDPVRQALACRAAAQDPCVTREGLVIADHADLHTLELAASAPAATTPGGAP